MGQMQLVNRDFNYPNIEDVASVEPPLVSARLETEGPYAGKVIVRVMFMTNTDVENPPVLNLNDDGTGTISFVTPIDPQPVNPFYVWYDEQFLSEDVRVVNIKLADTRTIPPTTSRGTETTVQSGTGNTIDD